MKIEKIKFKSYIFIKYNLAKINDIQIIKIFFKYNYIFYYLI